jgi:hypothetical protein
MVIIFINGISQMWFVIFFYVFLFVARVSFLCSGAVQAVAPLVVVQQINDKEMN